MDKPEFNIEDVIIKTEYFQDLLELLLSRLQPTFHCLKLIVKILLHGPDGSGKRLLARTAAKNFNINFHEERVADLFDENIVGTEKKVRAAITKYATQSPCLIYFTGYELFCNLEDPDLDRIAHSIQESFVELSESSSQPIIFIAATSNYHTVYKTHLSDIFQHDIKIKSPTLAQAEKILNSIKTDADLKSNPVILPSSHSNGEYFIGGLLDLFARAEVDLVKSSPNDECDPDEKEAEAGTRWLDIGGLSHVKDEIIDAIQLSIDYPQLKKSGLRRTGILLYGPPGTGKTLLARAVATECSLNFINVKGPELLNEYVGQSEDNVRKLFQKARESSPAVIFFDEIDSLAPNRGHGGESGGVMDRMVSQLLAEMDGVGKSDGVFVIGATNRVDLVDPSLLRPGRFDKVLEVPLPVGKENRLQILRALTRKIKLADDVNLDELESLAKPNMSGADFQGLCSRALQRTFNRCVELVESGAKSEDEVEVITTMEDFLSSLTD